MPPTTFKVCVVGAGIIGVSSAIQIQETCPGSEVTVVAEKFSPHTTSDGSGGFWEPHLIGDTPVDLVRDWGQKTLDHLTSILHSPSASDAGVSLVSGYLLSEEPLEAPTWKDQVFGFREVSDRELKQYPGLTCGFFYSTLILDVKQYLPLLYKRFESNGGKFVKRRIGSLAELGSENYDVVVNCTGVWANQLSRDKNVQPIRGQIIRVQAPWVKQFLIVLSGQNAESYILPGTNFVALGGTAQLGDWNEQVSEEDKRKIWEGCCKYMPSLQKARYDHDWVGLRPSRSTVRLESERMLAGNGKPMIVVHNYGHGGSGVTLHWGCAAHAARLVKAAFENKSKL